jgi:predicted nucleotidyltransferase
MTTQTLARTLFSRTRSSVFGELSRGQDGVYLRELERTTGIDSKQLLRELHALRDAGIISPTRVGNVVLYRFDPDCPIYEDLQAIIRKTVGLADVLRDMLKPYADQIELAYVFGSHARGEQRADSDVDVMIVGPASRRKLSTALRGIERALRRDVNAMFYTHDEYSKALEDSNSFVSRVHNGTRMDLDVDSEHEPAGSGIERRTLA